MHESAKPNPSKLRQVKLRASCDTCFRAKVKCSKALPVCSRCLGCGAECKYSPSSRAGKPKSGHRKAERHRIVEGSRLPTPSHAASYTTQSSILHEGAATSRESPPWPTRRAIFGSSEGEEHGRASSITLLPIVEENFPRSEGPRINADCSPFFGWVSPMETDITSTHFDHVIQPHSNPPPNLSTHHLSPPCFDQKKSSPFPSPPPELNLTRNVYSPISHHKTSTCRCFERCLDTLQTLHNSEGLDPSAPFDVILYVNEEAVGTCSALLGCSRCTGQPFSELQAMVIGTIIAKIISIYQNAWKDQFKTSREEFHQQLSVPFGNYRITGEDIRWLEMRIMMRDLQSLEDLLSKFRGLLVKSETESAAGIPYAWASHLHWSLCVSLEALKKNMNFLGVGE